MLKHVSYRSSTSLGRRASDFASCRSSSVPPVPKNAANDDSIMDSSSSNNTFSTSSPIKSCRSNSDASPLLLRASSMCKEDFPDQGFEDMSLLPSCFRTPDTISLSSAMSFTSLAPRKYNTLDSRQFLSLQHGKSFGTGKFSSRCSSTISLNDHQANNTVR